MWTNPKTKMVHTNVVPHQPLPFTRKYLLAHNDLEIHWYGIINNIIINSSNCCRYGG